MSDESAAVADNRRTEETLISSEPVDFHPFVNRRVVRPPHERDIALDIPEIEIGSGDGFRLYAENFGIGRRKREQLDFSDIHLDWRHSRKVRPRKYYLGRLFRLQKLAVLQKYDFFRKEKLRSLPVNFFGIEFYVDAVHLNDDFRILRIRVKNDVNGFLE